MSAGANGLTAAQITFFDSQVKAAYSQPGMLSRCAYVKRNMGAGTWKYPTVSRGQAKVHTPYSEIVPMGVTYTQVTAVPEKYVASDYTSIFDAAETNISEQAQLAGIIAAAIGRREDQILIDIWNATTMLTGHTVDTNVGGSGTGMNLDKARRAARALDDKGVPEDGRHMVLAAQAKEQLLGLTPVISSDFANVKALVTGQVKELMGFEWNFLAHGAGARPEGGLTVASSVRDGFAVHVDATGLGVVMAGKTTVDWIPQRRCWLTAQDYEAGAAVRDRDGVVKVQSTES